MGRTKSLQANINMQEELQKRSRKKVEQVSLLEPDTTLQEPCKKEKPKTVSVDSKLVVEAVSVPKDINSESLTKLINKTISKEKFKNLIFKEMKTLHITLENIQLLFIFTAK